MALAQGPLMFMMKWCVGEERCFALCVCVCVVWCGVCIHLCMFMYVSKLHGDLTCGCVRVYV